MTSIDIKATEASLLAEIHDNPDDNRLDGPKGIYADFLDDEGRTHEAEWVRIAAAEMNMGLRPLNILAIGGSHDGERILHGHFAYSPFVRLIKNIPIAVDVDVLTKPVDSVMEIECYKLERFVVFGREFRVARIVE